MTPIHDDTAILALPWPAAELPIVKWFLSEREAMMASSETVQQEIDIAGLYTLTRRGPYDKSLRGHKDTVHHAALIDDLRALKADRAKFHSDRADAHLKALASWNPSWYSGPRRSG